MQQRAHLNTCFSIVHTHHTINPYPLIFPNNHKIIKLKVILKLTLLSILVSTLIDHRRREQIRDQKYWWIVRENILLAVTITVRSSISFFIIFFSYSNSEIFLWRNIILLIWWLYTSYLVQICVIVLKAIPNVREAWYNNLFAVHFINSLEN